MPDQAPVTEATARAAWRSSAAEQVRTTLFRMLAGMRLLLLVYALAVNVARYDEFARPGLAAAAMVLMTLWTAFVSWAYDAPRRRRRWLFVADVGVAVLLLASTALTHSTAMQDRHAASIPTLWVSAAVLACAIGLGWWQAMVAAGSISAVELVVRTGTTGNTWANIFLLQLGAVVVGLMTRALCESAELRAAAERSAAMLAERARLARVVHDGVLQVLSLVQRQGAAVADTHPELGALSRLAAEQEVALRALVQYDARAGWADLHRASGGDSDHQGATADLMAAVEGLARPGVTCTGPGEPVLLAAPAAEELVAAVRECLANVERHVGADASAWVLVEDLGAEVVVTVRDVGPGIAEGRLEEAAAQGRMGVTGSIRGRLEELGGRAELFTGPGAGTEWTLTVPRDAADD